MVRVADESQDPTKLGVDEEAAPWQIVSYDSLPFIWASDGEAINATRGGVKGASSRFIIGSASSSFNGAAGFLDITDLGIQDDPRAYVLLINASKYAFPVETQTLATLSLSSADNEPITQNLIRVTGNGNELSVALLPFPVITLPHLHILQQMMDLKLVPYPNIIDAPCKTEHELSEVATQFFPFADKDYSFALAMCVYDWTSFSFFRIGLFNHFVYTSFAHHPHPLDMPTIARMIWTSSLPPYTPQDKDYMASLLMEPANSQEEVTIQLERVATQLRGYVDVESALISDALISLPRSSTFTIPLLYSGQVDILQYTTSRFLPLFLEFPGNAGPTSVPLEMPLEEGIKSMLAAGSFLTSKSFIAFAPAQADAIPYSNGILLILHPPPGAYIWPRGAYITPLSDDPQKIEYLMPPQTRFLVLNTSQQIISHQVLVVINLELVLD